MVDAEYFARALWGEGKTPDTARIGKAKRVAEQFRVPWVDIEALKASPVIQVAKVVEPVKESPIAVKRLRRRLRTGD